MIESRLRSLGMTKITKLLIVQILFIVSAVTIIEANITGIVFRDLPLNGTIKGVYGEYNATMEPGVANVTVTAYAVDGTVVQTKTAADGSYSLITVAGDYRVEFSEWPAYLEESSDANRKNTSVQFVSNDSTVDFGLHNPAEFTGTANPAMVSVVHSAGDTSGKYKTLVTFEYNSSGLSNAGINSSLDKVADNSIGSVWGLAYARKTKKLYSAAFLKRHVALGADGLGAIYVSGVSAGSNASLFVTIPDAGSIANNAARGVEVERNATSHDNQAYPLIGKAGLGDIDISDDEKYLYVVNLHNKHLYEIEIESATSMDRGEIPDPGCQNGEWRPFSVKYYHKGVYLGGICDASTGDFNDTSATIYHFDGNNFTTVLNFDLNYSKVSVTWNDRTDSNSSRWNPWHDTVVKFNDGVLNVRYVQPILSDIEFDTDGTMILAFMDRFGHQVMDGNYLYNSDELYRSVIAGGDILKACLDSNGNYVLESDGICGGVTGAGQDHNASGPGGGEFYDDMFYRNRNATDRNRGHGETSNGAVALLAGSGEIVLNSMDPLDHPVSWRGDYHYFRSGGPVWYSNGGADAGKQRRGFQLFADQRESVGFGKGTGIGDLELLLEPAPIEIGNRIWLDTDGDGVQDPDELSISGVTVQLLDENGVVIAEVNTSNDGTYIFSNDSTGIDDVANGYDYNITQLEENKEYTVRIPNVSGSNKQAVLGSYVLTVVDKGTGTDGNINDSDGMLNGNHADSTVSSADISLSGANNHSFDFGFSPPVSLGSLIWYDADNDGVQDVNEAGIAGLRVILLDASGNLVPGVASVVTDTNGNYYFGNLAPGIYCVRVESNTANIADYVMNSTVQNSNPDDNNAADSNIAGGSTANGYISAIITLTPNNEPYGNNEKSNLSNNGNEQDGNANDLTDRSGNMTLDMGFTKTGNWSGNISKDNDNDNIGDINLLGVAVELFTDPNGDGDPSDGTSVDITLTDADGNYRFTGLVPGDYVALETQPVGLDNVSENEGGADNDKPDNGMINSIAGHVNASENDVNNDFVEKERMPINDSADDPADSPVYYHIGTHFWIDSNKNGIFDTTERPIDGALVELFNTNNIKIAETYTANGGEYGFDVPAGKFYVKFHIPADSKYEGYVFSTPHNNSDNSININRADQNGIIKSVEVGPNAKTEDLTLDAGINCECTNAPIHANGGDALNLFGMLAMMAMTLIAALFFIRKEEELRV